MTNDIQKQLKQYCPHMSGSRKFDKNFEILEVDIIAKRGTPVELEYLVGKDNQELYAYATRVICAYLTSVVGKGPDVLCLRHSNHTESCPLRDIAN